MEIVHQVHLIDAIKGSNVYLLAGRKLALIDTGPPGSTGPILRFIADLGRRPDELSWIFITHGHADHIGSLWELRCLTKANVVASYRASAADFAVREYAVFPYIGGLHVVCTPGHTMDSVSMLLEKKRILFLGDSVTAMESDAYPTLQSGEQPYESALLRKLAQYAVEVCCFGHGEPQYLEPPLGLARALSLLAGQGKE